MKKIKVAYIVTDKDTAEHLKGITPISVPDNYRLEDLIKDSNAKSVAILDGTISFGMGGSWTGRMSQSFTSGKFDPDYNTYFLEGVEHLEDIANLFEKYCFKQGKK